jgi:hypothetical protein
LSFREIVKPKKAKRSSELDLAEFEKLMLNTNENPNTSIQTSTIDLENSSFQGAQSTMEALLGAKQQY